MGLGDFIQGAFDMIGHVADGIAKYNSLVQGKPADGVRKLAEYWTQMSRDEFNSFRDTIKAQANHDERGAVVLRRFRNAHKQVVEILSIAEESENRAYRKLANAMDSMGADEFKDVISLLDAIAESGRGDAEAAAALAHKAFEWSRGSR